jgi:hypothetical protein
MCSIYLNRNETRILDYPLQQEKLVPCLSTTYAYLIAFIKLDTYFHQLKTNESIYLEQLPEVSDPMSFVKKYQISMIFCRISFMQFHLVSKHMHQL